MYVAISVYTPNINFKNRHFVAVKSESNNCKFEQLNLEVSKTLRIKFKIRIMHMVSYMMLVKTFSIRGGFQNFRDPKFPKNWVKIHLHITFSRGSMAPYPLLLGSANEYIYALTDKSL